MSMETSPAATAPPVAERNDSARKPKAHGAAGESGAPTFLSLLTSMETDASPALASSATFKPVLADAALPALLPPDASALLTQNPGRAVHLEDLNAPVADPDLLAAVPAQWTALPGLSPPALSPSAGGHVAHGLDKFAGKAEATGAAGKTAGADGGAGFAADAGTLQSSATQHVLNTNTQAMQRRADTDRAAQEAQTLSSSKGADARAYESRAAEDAKVDARTSITTPGANVSAVAAPLMDMLGALARGAAAPSRSTDRAAARPSFVPAGSALAGSWTEQSGVSGGGAANAASYAPDASTATPETGVAEKLNYWISRGVQNAELKLDAFGGGSVQVSISVQGHEAQVEFRSDQAEARKILNDAMPLLRDLLEEEGMLLSGGFVGASAHRDPGAQERRGHSQATTISVRGTEAQAVDRMLAPACASGRTVDLFV